MTKDPRPRSLVWLRALVVFSLLSLSSGCAIINLPLSLPGETELREFVVRPAEHRLVRNKVLLLDISGVISAQERFGFLNESPSTVADVRDALDKAEKDRRIKAVVLRIDSPGGEVTASDIIYEEIKRFKKKRAESGHPVVVLASILGEGASGGYYIALAADKIFVHPTTITGAIGVLATFPNLSGLTRKIGVDVRVIKSSDKKDLGSIWRDFTPDERRILQQTIDEFYERFVRVVAENRPQLDREAVLRLADGRIYTARQALDNHLVDGIAYLDGVIEKAKKMADITDAAVVTYRRAHRFEGSIYSRSPGGGIRAAPSVNLLQINARDIFGSFHRPGFYYLWMP